MKANTLRKAIDEAKRFIKVANKVKIIDDKYSKVYVKDYTKQTAACRRASMDLSRVLSDLRQGR